MICICTNNNGLIRHVFGVGYEERLLVTIKSDNNDEIWVALVLFVCIR